MPDEGGPGGRTLAGARTLTGAALQALYQELILDHYRRPRGRGELPDATGRAAGRSADFPLCADDLMVAVAVDGGVVREARFTGSGCSISQASASMMTELVRGASADEVAELRARVVGMLDGDAEAAADERLGAARALAGVARFPMRVRCAMLPWNALLRAVSGERSESPSGER